MVGARVSISAMRGDKTTAQRCDRLQWQVCCGVTWCRGKAVKIPPVTIVWMDGDVRLQHTKAAGSSPPSLRPFMAEARAIAHIGGAQLFRVVSVFPGAVGGGGTTATAHLSPFSGRPVTGAVATCAPRLPPPPSRPAVLVVVEEFVWGAFVTCSPRVPLLSLQLPATHHMPPSLRRAARVQMTPRALR